MNDANPPDVSVLINLGNALSMAMSQKSRAETFRVYQYLTLYRETNLVNGEGTPAIVWNLLNYLGMALSEANNDRCFRYVSDAQKVLTEYRADRVRQRLGKKVG